MKKHAKYFQFRFFIVGPGWQFGSQYLLVFILLLLTASCKKYLDAKPDMALSTASSVKGLQGFLDNFQVMNQVSTQAGEIASDNYYITDASYPTLNKDSERDAYLWKSSVFSYDADDWKAEYNIVYMANVVLDGLEKIKRDDANAYDWDNCKGSALVFRAKSFFEIAQVWAKAYDSSVAKNELGIPLRITSDFNAPSTRASMEDTYIQIINDLKQAIPLLPDYPSHVFRPSKSAAYGFMARTYISMRKYEQAKLYSDSCLLLKSNLLNFNTLDTNSTSPFSLIQYTNPEDVMHSSTKYSKQNLIFLYGRVDSTLYQLYNSNDLRKLIYFRKASDGLPSYKASYDNANVIYNGIATDEMYLIRSECLARQGDVINAMKDLNTLLEKRWKTGTFVPNAATSPSDALNKILTERRKELFYRTLRFTDIKRLNKEGANINLKRIIKGDVYTLPANDSKFALPIPDLVIERSGIQQNQ